jgi:hypothetical protein
MLTLFQSLDTTGARAVEVFEHDAVRYLVIPQLAADVPGQPAKITVGNSDIESPVYRWESGRFVPHQRLAVPGGEDAEFFRIGDRAFLATASLRTGAGPYELDAHSTIFELRHGEFMPFQRIPTFAAKQWKHFRIGARDFLALAQGVAMEGVEPKHHAKSCIYEWNGQDFQWLQDVESAWGYNWLHFQLGGQDFLAYADHVAGSRLLRWNGAAFEPFQALEEKTGRAFCFFERAGRAWLVFACLHDDTVLYAWDGSRFARQQVVSGPGGRELRWLAAEDRLVLVNFLKGSREKPEPSIQSGIYRFSDAGLEQEHAFPTVGATDAAIFRDGGKTYLCVSQAMNEEIRFRSESKVYVLDAGVKR